MTDYSKFSLETPNPKYDLNTKKGLCLLGNDILDWLKEHPDNWLQCSLLARKQPNEYCFCFTGVAGYLVYGPPPKKDIEWRNAAYRIHDLFKRYDIIPNHYVSMMHLNDTADNYYWFIAKLEETLKQVSLGQIRLGGPGAWL